MNNILTDYQKLGQIRIYMNHSLKIWYIKCRRNEKKKKKKKKKKNNKKQKNKTKNNENKLRGKENKSGEQAYWMI